MCRAVGPHDWKSLFCTVCAIVLLAKLVHQNHADLSCMTARGACCERQKESMRLQKYTRAVWKVSSHVI